MKKKKKVTIFILVGMIMMGALYQMYVVRDTSVYNKISQKGIIFGKTNAPITMIIYTSFTCEKCTILSNNIHELLLEKIESGQLKLIYKPTNKDFFNVEDDKFNNLNKIFQYYNDKNLYYNDIRNLSNLNEAECLYRKDLYETIQKEIEQCNISVLPTFYINSKKYIGNYTEEQFNELLQK